MATRGHDELVGATTVARATGRSREDWFELLDTAGAAGWTHTGIAEWLVTEHRVDGWWAQSLTVGYEQARGLRLPGQRPDGTFDATASKTIARGAPQVFPLVSDDAQVAQWAGTGWRVRSATSPRRARLEGPEGERVGVELTVVSPAKVRVAVQHKKLPHPEAVTEKKAFWQDALARLATRATRPSQTIKSDRTRS